jgi:hypothetical protein
LEKQQKKIKISFSKLKYFLHFPRKGGYMEEKHEEIFINVSYRGFGRIACLLLGESGDNDNEADPVHIV